MSDTDSTSFVSKVVKSGYGLSNHLTFKYVLYFIKQEADFSPLFKVGEEVRVLESVEGTGTNNPYPVYSSVLYTVDRVLIADPLSFMYKVQGSYDLSEDPDIRYVFENALIKPDDIPPF